MQESVQLRRKVTTVTLSGRPLKHGRLIVHQSTSAYTCNPPQILEVCGGPEWAKALTAGLRGPMAPIYPLFRAGKAGQRTPSN